MTRHEALQLSFAIKEDPGKYDFSGLLYDAVGMIFREKDISATFAATKLVESIQEASKGKLSDFCKKKIDIIEREHMKRLPGFVTKLAKLQEIADNQQEQRFAAEAARKAALGEYDEW